MSQFVRFIGATAVAALVMSAGAWQSWGEGGDQGHAANTDLQTTDTAPGERLALVPAACTGTDEPELEVRRLAFGDPIHNEPFNVQNASLLAMAFGSPILGLARSEDPGPLTYTVDGGHTWSSLGDTAKPNVLGTGVEIAFVNGAVGWAIGFGSYNDWPWRAVATFDSGSHWREYIGHLGEWEPMAQMLAGTRVHDGRWVMPDGADVTAAYASIDGGQSWFALPVPASQAEAVRTVRHYDRLVLFGAQNLFISASDLDFPVVDADWRGLAPALQRQNQEVRFGMTTRAFHDLTDSQAFWAVPPDEGAGSQPSDLRERLPSYLLRTLDGGRNWRAVPLTLPIDLPSVARELGVESLHMDIYDIAMVDGLHGWLSLRFTASVVSDWSSRPRERTLQSRTFCTGDGAETWHLVRGVRSPPTDSLGLLRREQRWGGGNHLVYALDYRHIWFDRTSQNAEIYRVAPIETGWWPAGHPPAVDQSSAVE